MSQKKIKKKRQQLVLMRGLPSSGKSTFADVLVKKGYKRCNKDALRLMVYGERFNQEHEGLIETLDLSIIDILLREGHDVVVDECNGPNGRISMLSDLFYGMEYGDNIDIHIEFMNTPLDVCIERDKKREGSVGEEVIMGMWNHSFKKLYEEVPTKDAK